MTIRQNLRDIMTITNCDEDMAAQVEHTLDCTDFDYSEATAAEFKNAVNEAYKDLV